MRPAIFCFDNSNNCSHQHKVLIGTSGILQMCLLSGVSKWPSAKEMKSTPSNGTSSLQKRNSRSYIPLSLQPDFYYLSLVKRGGCHLFPSFISPASRGWLSTVGLRSTVGFWVSRASSQDGSLPTVSLPGLPADGTTLVKRQLPAHRLVSHPRTHKELLARRGVRQPVFIKLQFI